MLTTTEHPSANNNGLQCCTSEAEAAAEVLHETVSGVIRSYYGNILTYSHQ